MHKPPTPTSVIAQFDGGEVDGNHNACVCTPNSSSEMKKASPTQRLYKLITSDKGLANQPRQQRLSLCALLTALTEALSLLR